MLRELKQTTNTKLQNNKSSAPAEAAAERRQSLKSIMMKALAQLALYLYFLQKYIIAKYLICVKCDKVKKYFIHAEMKGFFAT